MTLQVVQQMSPEDIRKQQTEDHLHLQYVQSDIKQIKDGQVELSKALQMHMEEELQIKGQIEKRLAVTELLVKISVVLGVGSFLGSPELVKKVLQVLLHG